MSSSSMVATHQSWTRGWSEGLAGPLSDRKNEPMSATPVRRSVMRDATPLCSATASPPAPTVSIAARFGPCYSPPASLPPPSLAGSPQPHRGASPGRISCVSVPTPVTTPAKLIMKGLMSPVLSSSPVHNAAVTSPRRSSTCTNPGTVVAASIATATSCSANAPPPTPQRKDFAPFGSNKSRGLLPHTQQPIQTGARDRVEHRPDRGEHRGSAGYPVPRGSARNQPSAVTRLRVSLPGSSAELSPKVVHRTTCPGFSHSFSGEFSEASPSNVASPCNRTGSATLPCGGGTLPGSPHASSGATMQLPVSAVGGIAGSHSFDDGGSASPPNVASLCNRTGSVALPCGGSAFPGSPGSNHCGRFGTVSSANSLATHTSSSVPMQLPVSGVGVNGDDIQRHQGDGSPGNQVVKRSPSLERYLGALKEANASVSATAPQRSAAVPVSKSSVDGSVASIANRFPIPTTIATVGPSVPSMQPTGDTSAVAEAGTRPVAAARPVVRHGSTLRSTLIRPVDHVGRTSSHAASSVASNPVVASGTEVASSVTGVSSTVSESRGLRGWSGSGYADGAKCVRGGLQPTPVRTVLSPVLTLRTEVAPAENHGIETKGGGIRPVRADTLPPPQHVARRLGKVSEHDVRAIPTEGASGCGTIFKQADITATGPVVTNVAPVARIGRIPSAQIARRHLLSNKVHSVARGGGTATAARLNQRTLLGSPSKRPAPSLPAPGSQVSTAAEATLSTCSDGHLEQVESPQASACEGHLEQVESFLASACEGHLEQVDSPQATACEGHLEQVESFLASACEGHLEQVESFLASACEDPVPANRFTLVEQVAPITDSECQGSPEPFEAPEPSVCEGVVADFVSADRPEPAYQAAPATLAESEGSPEPIEALREGVVAEFVSADRPEPVYQGVVAEFISADRPEPVNQGAPAAPAESEGFVADCVSADEPQPVYEAPPATVTESEGLPDPAEQAALAALATCEGLPDPAEQAALAALATCEDPEEFEPVVESLDLCWGHMQEWHEEDLEKVSPSAHISDSPGMIFEKFRTSEDMNEVFSSFQKLFQLAITATKKTACQGCPAPWSHDGRVRWRFPYEAIRVLLGGHWKAKLLWKKLDAKVNCRPEYSDAPCAQGRLSGRRVVIVGAGPAGLRAALELRLLGARVTVLEKRDRFTRLNRLHLWKWCGEELKAFGARSLEPPPQDFGSDPDLLHIGISELQSLLLKTALLLGVQVVLGVEYKSVEWSGADNSWSVLARRARSWGTSGSVDFDNTSTGVLWTAEGTGENSVDAGVDLSVGPRIRKTTSSKDVVFKLHSVGMLIGAGGLGCPVPASVGMEASEIPGAEAIGLVANFAPLLATGSSTASDDRSLRSFALARQFYGPLFSRLAKETGADLENVVYTKSKSSHYFVMTPKSRCLADCGVLKDLSHKPLLNPSNVDRDELDKLVRRVVGFRFKQDQAPLAEVAQGLSTELEYADAGARLFDFSKMRRSAEGISFLSPPDADAAVAGVDATCTSVADDGTRDLMVVLAGDCLVEPFWPEGLGIVRGFFGALDASHAACLWAGGSDKKAVRTTFAAAFTQLKSLAAASRSRIIRDDEDNYGCPPWTRYRAMQGGA
eukprot:TRINITY_DN8356_c0_g1_i1.p1 TRINITY_DN8356_c0_g1~~TRINITY_DN8356_c0_g1_i1.p1  ORF type:complete len:1622 (-),score=251.14 TRINITY_DN8356_c0_g1_i1:169-5001(-)